MLDRDLATLYGVETRVLTQAVRRNQQKFPEDFMFQLTKAELEDWRSQIVMTNPRAKMSLRRRPFAFTEHGVVMAANILRSEQAALVSIEVVRVFVRLRRALVARSELARELAELRDSTDERFDLVAGLLEGQRADIEQIRAVLEAVEALLASTDEARRPIGFLARDDEGKEG